MDAAPGLVVVRPDATVDTKQKLRQFVGVSEQTTGSTGISMNLVIIPPGGAAEPHIHKGYETAIYLVKGRVNTKYGPGLRESVVCEEGDFVFIAADMPHQPVNLSDTEPAHALVARNDLNEQERVVPYDPATDN